MDPRFRGDCQQVSREGQVWIPDLIGNDREPNMKKIDYTIAGLIGFFAGIFVIPVAYNIASKNPFVLLSLPWVLAVGAVAGVFVFGLIGRKIPSFIQMAKFAVVGVLNTAIDFGTLNIISIVTGVTGGLIVGGVNVPGVALALTNAYFWNKFWVFNHRDNKGALNDLPKFLLVSGIGIVINSGIVILATSYPTTAFNAKTLLNVAKLGATVFSLVWNFLGYKFIVFKSDETQPEHEVIAPL